MSSTKPRVLITGGSGLLAFNWAWSMRENADILMGTHLHKVALPDSRIQTLKLDLDSTEKLSEEIRLLKPDVIIHTAGLTNVDKCEKNPTLANRVNAVLSRNVAMVASCENVDLIHISTDHLFSGNKSMYKEGDAVQPLNAYGVSKYTAEKWVQETYPRSLIIRTNFFGWGHKKRHSFSDWILRSLKAGDSLSLYDDINFTPILADALARASMKLLNMGASGIFNVVGDERISKYEFGVELAKYFGFSYTAIEQSKISQSGQTVSRPQDMSLDNSKAKKQLGYDLGTIESFLFELKKQQQQGRPEMFFNAVS